MKQRRTIAELQRIVGAAHTPAELKKKYAAARKARDRITEEFIADGRGQERPSDYRMKTDSLSKRANANDALMSELRFEAEKYVGPGRPAYDLLDSGKLP